MQVSDARRGARRGVHPPVLEEGEHPAAVVRVPVREDDARDAGDGDLEGLDVPDDRARVGPSVEEREVRPGIVDFGFL